MKIAIIADPFIPIPPELYGGIERIIDMLIKGLIDRGHEVTLFAHPDSKTHAHLIPYKELNSWHGLDILGNIWTSTSELLRGQYDLVHSFGRLIYLSPLLPLKLPKLMSYQREPTTGGIKRAAQLARQNTLTFTGCSEYIAAKIRPYASAYAIHNGVPLNVYDFQPYVNDDAPLVFLGRIEYTKGAHLAIEVAQKTGRKLILAGNIPLDIQSMAYFREQIEPHLDGQQISYIGPVNDQQKNVLLGNASAFLMPILWDEPFGIVMAEAMACGTPVIGLNRGSVPEVIEHGISGYICSNLEEMENAVKNISSIRRQEVINRAINHFSDTVIVNNYINLYQQILQ